MTRLIASSLLTLGLRVISKIHQWNHPFIQSTEMIMYQVSVYQDSSLGTDTLPTPQPLLLSKCSIYNFMSHFPNFKSQNITPPSSPSCLALDPSPSSSQIINLYKKKTEFSQMDKETIEGLYLPLGWTSSTQKQSYIVQGTKLCIDT